jgi:Cu/Ag efflux protein CusF
MLYRLTPLVSLLLILTACTSHPAPANPQRYALTGRIISITTSTSSISVDTDAIPNFMPAMTMDYKVKNSAEIKPLKPGDAITATLVKQDEDYWLENLHSARKVASPPTSASPR